MSGAEFGEEFVAVESRSDELASFLVKFQPCANLKDNVGDAFTIAETKDVADAVEPESVLHGDRTVE